MFIALHCASTQEYGAPANNNNLQTNQQEPLIFKHVLVYVAPQEPTVQPKIKKIRPAIQPDKHYNIIFVKAPSQSNRQQQIVELPPQPKTKTIVYVLMKNRNNDSNNIKIRRPAPTKPTSPEVYFIRYRPSADKNGEIVDSGKNSVSEESSNSGPLQPSYGVPV